MWESHNKIRRLIGKNISIDKKKTSSKPFNGFKVDKSISYVNSAFVSHQIYVESKPKNYNVYSKSGDLLKKYQTPFEIEDVFAQNCFSYTMIMIRYHWIKIYHMHHHTF